MRLGILAVLLLLATVACDQLAKETETGPTRPTENRSHPIGRFEKIQNFRVDVALDTQTGQLCKTWEWQSTNRNSPDPYENLPTCAFLYGNFQTTERIEGFGIRTGTDNANGKRVFSCDGGKNWNWADGSGPRSSTGNIAQ